MAGWEPARRADARVTRRSTGAIGDEEVQRSTMMSCDTNGAHRPCPIPPKSLIGDVTPLHGASCQGPNY
jgi:hypothetical protein